MGKNIIKKIFKLTLFITVINGACYADFTRNSISISFNYDFFSHIVLIGDSLPFWINLNYGYFINKNLSIKGGISYHKRMKGSWRTRLAKQIYAPLTINYTIGNPKSKFTVGLGGNISYYKIPGESVSKYIKQSSFGFYPLLETGYVHLPPIKPQIFFNFLLTIIFDYHSPFIILAPTVSIGYGF